MSDWLYVIGVEKTKLTSFFLFHIITYLYTLMYLSLFC